MLGGMTSIRGVLLASILFWAVFEGLRFLDFGLGTDTLAALRYVLIGLLLIVLMAVRPQGIFGRRQEMVLSD
jgi:branched-chain amino acid transport system permease protein